MAFVKTIYTVHVSLAILNFRTIDFLVTLLLNLFVHEDS